MQHVASWCELVEQRVRDEVRTLRLDPMHDGGQVHDLIQRLSAEIVIDSIGHTLDERDNSVAADIASVSQIVQHSICGFGPLQPFFEDESVEEIWDLALARERAVGRGMPGVPYEQVDRIVTALGAAVGRIESRSREWSDHAREIAAAVDGRNSGR